MFLGFKHVGGKCYGVGCLIDYLNDWDQQVNSIGGLTQEERNRMLMRRQTVTGWKITSKFI